MPKTTVNRENLRRLVIIAGWPSVRAFAGHLGISDTAVYLAVKEPERRPGTYQRVTKALRK